MVSSHDHLAGAQGGFLKIFFLCGKNLPARHAAPEDLNGAHAWEFTAQTFMMLVRRSEPDTVIGSVVLLVPQDEYNFVFHVDRKAPKHRSRPRRHRGNCIQNKLVRDGFALFSGKALATGHGEKVARVFFRRFDHRWLSNIRLRLIEWATQLGSDSI